MRLKRNASLKEFLELVAASVWRLPHTSKQFSEASRVSKNQLNSDTIYPEIESDSTGKELRPANAFHFFRS